MPLPTANSDTDTADTTTATTDDDADERLWCYCNHPSFGDMVMCDNKKFTIQWSTLVACTYGVHPKESGIAHNAVNLLNLRNNANN